MAAKKEACGFPFHPLANLFPLMRKSELTSLTEDIRTNHLQEAVILCDGMILDGRNRALAIETLCKEDSDDPRECLEYEDWTKYFEEPTSDILSWVASRNLHRRHLSPTRRKEIAIEFERLFAEQAKERKAEGGRASAPGRPAEKDRVEPPELSEERRARTKAAEVLGVSPHGVRQAKRIFGQDSEAIPELQEAVRNEEVSLDAAAAIATEEPEVQRKAVAGGKKGVAEAAKRLRNSQPKARDFNPASSEDELEQIIMATAHAWAEEAQPNLIALLKRVTQQLESVLNVETA